MNIKEVNWSDINKLEGKLLFFSTALCNLNLEDIYMDVYFLSAAVFFFLHSIIFEICQYH